MANKQVIVAPGARKLYLKEFDKFILIRPFITYGHLEQNILDSDRLLEKTENGTIEYERDLEAEQEWLEEVKALHPAFARGTNHDFFSLHSHDFIADYWFLSMTNSLQARGVEVLGFDTFKNFRFEPRKPEIKVHAVSKQDWFELEFSVVAGDQYISLKSLRRAIAERDNQLKLGNGKLAILPEDWMKKMDDYLRIGQIHGDSLRISKFHYNALDEVFSQLGQPELLQEIAEKRHRLQQFTEMRQVEMPAMPVTLRHYQQAGFRWLHFLHEFRWGGILADDMGLGKTLQMLTFLKSIVEQGIKTNLVVLPTSLLFNWQNEIQKFCPDLNYYLHYGSNRTISAKEWKKYDLIITSYGLLVSDIDKLRKIQFGYVVLDESQAIKNPASKRFKAVSLLKAYNRIAMTGTPIENQTLDLYAQLSFANPGMFFSMEHFKHNYAIPIDRNSDQQAARELNRIIHPFILRRTKEMVATELPPKIEDVIYCEMGPDQRKIYDAYRNDYRNEILGRIETEGLEQSKLHVLQALTRLRQICNSPALVNDDVQYENDSVKIKELVRHIREKTGNHKLLIFSQFVGMLKLIQNELKALEITHTYLDGGTSQDGRRQEVERFQSDEDVRVFLISLKAGGSGLNLIAADYVYIVDPWWNPAVENQAIDRCYRIGQDKKVIAYRMICKDTLEEKILNLQAKKQSTADAIVQTDEHVMKQITQEDIADLFA